MLNQERNVFAALAQGRHTNLNDVQAIIEVRTKTTRHDLRREVLVRGRDQAHVGLDDFIAAQPLETLLLEHAQQLRLGSGRKVADLVQEQGALMGLLELADPAPVRVGEGAALVAEQLALQQRFRNGRTVDRQEGCRHARAVVQQGTRY